MHREKLLLALKQYASGPYILEEEAPTLQRFLEFVMSKEDCFGRSPGGHVTSSSWIVNHERTHALLTHHRKFNLWCQLGGHNDGDSDCAAVALKEGWEESGIEDLQLMDVNIFDIDIHTIPTACAFHYDVRYLIQAPKDAQYVVSAESHDLAWVPIEEIEQYCKERSVTRLNDKFKQHFR